MVIRVTQQPLYKDLAKILVDLTNHGEGICGCSIVYIAPKPHEDTASVSKNLAHSADLLSFLFIVFLIYAKRISPE
jgi:hypothetical protein